MEQVFVVPRESFFQGRWPQGFVPLGGETANHFLTSCQEEGFFVDRQEAEERPAWKQPIPYCLLTREEEFFLVRRRGQGTEGRLHGLYSVGLGGHIGPEDLDPNSGLEPASEAGLIHRALWRELHEELVLPDLEGRNPEFLGLLNDDSNAVGSVHLGLVFRLSLDPGSDQSAAGTVRVREVSKLEGGFQPLVELRQLWQDPGCFETWSMIVIEALVFRPETSGNLGVQDISLQSVEGQQGPRGYAREEYYDGGEYV